MSFWIYANENPRATTLYYFKKTFSAKKGDLFDLRISADTRYQLYINGSLICEGPCQGAAHQRYFEVADASSALTDGENEILVKVQYVSSEHFRTVYRGVRAALWFDGKLTSNRETYQISGDESWLCFRDDGVKYNAFVGIHNSMPQYEEWSSEEKLTPVEICKWFEPTISTHGFTPWGTVQPYNMYERTIPQMREFPKKKMTEVLRGDGYIVYDSGEYTTAKVYFSLNAPKNSEINITYAECCSFGEPVGAMATKKAVRDDILAEGSRVDGARDIIHAKGEKQTFSPFWFRAFRFIKIEYPKDAECQISAPEYGSYFYPFDEAGSFECSSERYNNMWHISRNTLLCCSHETYVDCPYYEQSQYSMDGGLEMLYTFRTSTDTLLPLKIVRDLAASQIHDGMICAHYPSTTTQIIPDFTLFWVIMVRDYLLYTNDLENISDLMGTVDKALEAFENLKNADGLIGPTHYWAFVDWVPGWQRGVPPKGETEPLTVTCLMYAAALKAASELCIAMSKNARAREYLERAEKMTAAVNSRCYNEELGLYRDTPDSETYSQHTTVWAVLSGAVTGDEASALVDRTFNSSVKVATCTFSMNYYLFRALEKAERYCYAKNVFEGWEKMLDLHCTTWCENPDNPRSECHAWSSAPTYEFSAVVLGVLPTENGYRSLRIKPNIVDLPIDRAKGTVPTPYGIVSVDWKKKDGIFKLKFALPEGADINAEVILPDGSVINKIGNNADFECKI